MSRKLSGRASQALLVVMTMLVLAACGGGGTSDNPDSGAGNGGGTGAAAEKPEVVIGVVGARVGPISNVGVGVADALKDWFEMVNAGGGINGRQVRLLEVETEYEVPRAVEAYTRMRQEKAAGIVVLGSALSDALRPQSQQDQIPIMFPGQGNATTVDGTANPYAFPAAPTYAHQASALAQWAADDWAENGGEGAPKISCTAWGTPAGIEFCDGVEEAANELSFEIVARNAVAPGSVDAVPQVLELKRAQPDYAFHSTVFGQAAAFLSAACQEQLETTMLTWHWAVTENELASAGADCLERMNYTGAFMSTMPIAEPEAVQMLQEYWESEGKQPSKHIKENQLYGNGLAIANIVAEALRLADEQVGDGEITGADFKAGLESISGFEGHGTLCPTTMSAANHGGNRALNLYRVSGGHFTEIAKCVEGPVLSIEPELEG